MPIETTPSTPTTLVSDAQRAAHLVRPYADAAFRNDQVRQGIGRLEGELAKLPPPSEVEGRAEPTDWHVRARTTNQDTPAWARLAEAKRTAAEAAAKREAVIVTVRTSIDKAQVELAPLLEAVPDAAAEAQEDAEIERLYEEHWRLKRRRDRRRALVADVAVLSDALTDQVAGHKQATEAAQAAISRLEAERAEYAASRERLETELAKLRAELPKSDQELAAIGESLIPKIIPFVGSMPPREFLAIIRSEANRRARGMPV